MYSGAPLRAGGGLCAFTPRLVRTWIPDGDAGTEATVAEMARLVRETWWWPLTREVAAGIITGAGTDIERARRLRRWLSKRYVFVPDPPELELVQAPPVQLCSYLQLGYLSGDCDDLAVLAAALGAAAGLPSRFVVIALEPDGPYAHVWTELGTSEGWLELDLVADVQGLKPAQAGARRMVRRLGL